MGKGKRAQLVHNSSGIGGTTNQRNSLAAKNDTSIGDRLIPGRHPCKCQARKHQLVMNCLNCGKIVCMQEGSGPCFFCGALVCTPEEKEILDRGSRKSAELYEKLMGKPYEGPKGLSLSNLGLDLNKATEFRNKLLEADADSERTKVFDLESDYSHVDKDPFLSADERKRVRKRLQELKDMKERRRKQLVFNLNLMDLSISENKTSQCVNQCDPVIEEIMYKSEERRKALEAIEETAVDPRWIPKGFVPKYPRDGGTTFRSNICDYVDTDSVALMNDAAAILEVESKGYTIAMEQPYASLISYGKIKYFRWNEDLQLKGPIFVCSFSKPVSITDIRKAMETYSSESATVSLDFTPGSIHGRVFLGDCFTEAEFRQEYGTVNLAGEGEFVLIFTVCEPLRIPIPFISSRCFFQLDKEMRRAMSDVFKN